ncbi:MAG: DNA/RNA nuclease SfsA [Bacillota bacterium]|nr:DNA/RNA nuclease SfsA [Bacillota bacterium]
MKYEKITQARLINRDNRFVARVALEDENSLPYTSLDEVGVHVKNTGRCKELMVPGCRVYLEDFQGRMGTRKMRYSLVAVEKELENRDKLLINMDSQAPNKVVYEALKDGKFRLPGLEGKLSLIKPEKTYGKSRFDFYVECENEDNSKKDIQKAFIEVKGVTLEFNGFARFPDAPTERGLKHVKEMMEVVQAGYKGYIVFVVQMKGMYGFGPNYETHPEFGEALAEARRAGVHVLAYDCIVRPDELVLDQPVKIELKGETNF